MTGAQYRRMALKLPRASEGVHGRHPDFLVGGKIFCTLAFEQEGYGVLMLTPKQQAAWVEDSPEVFSTVPGGRVRMGMTVFDWTW